MSLLSDAEVKQVAEKLPAAPRLLVELGELMNARQTELDEVVAVLRQDPLLVSQIIRAANSAFYAPPEPVGSIERAVGLIGFAEVHRVVGAVAAKQLGDQTMRLYPIEGPKLRVNALFVAVLMEEMAKPAGERPRSCYTVGLLRTIGMMALERIAPDAAAIPAFRQSGETALDVWEQAHWGITNVEAAEKILLHWRLPRETVTAIRHHYRPAGRHNPIAHLLTLAAAAAADRFYCIPGEESYWQLTAENFAKAGLRERDYQLACEKAQRKYEQLNVVVA